MTSESLGIVCAAGGLFAGLVFGIYCASAAYRNGVTDGYGYSREPSCPGYARAGEYLRETMAHRWPELRDRKEPPCGA